MTKVDALVRSAVSAGARVLTGGKRPAGDGFYYQPTVLVDVARTRRCWSRRSSARGIGREGGHDGMLDYLESKYIAVGW